MGAKTYESMMANTKGTRIGFSQKRAAAVKIAAMIMRQMSCRFLLKLVMKKQIERFLFQYKGFSPESYKNDS